MDVAVGSHELKPVLTSAIHTRMHTFPEHKNVAQIISTAMMLYDWIDGHKIVSYANLQHQYRYQCESVTSIGCEWIPTIIDRLLFYHQIESHASIKICPPFSHYT